jgi:hypothetical protein
MARVTPRGVARNPAMVIYIPGWLASVNIAAYQHLRYRDGSYLELKKFYPMKFWLL